MTNIIMEYSSETPLQVAILHYFQFVATTTTSLSTESTTRHNEESSSSSPAVTGGSAENAKKQRQEKGTLAQQRHSIPTRGQKVVAALLQEFPELATFTATAAPLLPVPELKVRFDAHPFHVSRLHFLESRVAFLELQQQPQNCSLSTAPPAAPPACTVATNFTGMKSKDRPYTALMNSYPFLMGRNATNLTGIQSKDAPCTAVMTTNNHPLAPERPVTGIRASATRSYLMDSPSATYMNAMNLTGMQSKDPPYTAVMTTNNHPLATERPVTGIKASATRSNLMYSPSATYMNAMNLTGIQSKDPPYTALVTTNNHPLATERPVAGNRVSATSSYLMDSPSATTSTMNATCGKRKDPPYTALVKNDQKNDQKKQRPSKVNPADQEKQPRQTRRSARSVVPPSRGKKVWWV